MHIKVGKSCSMLLLITSSVSWVSVLYIIIGVVVAANRILYGVH